MLRKEHPNPQFLREEWENLNGTWEFDFDFGRSAIERKFYETELSKKIEVPFCPESKLSGIEYKDFMPAVIYRRAFRVPEDWKGGRVFLHFGAVDYFSNVFINSVSVGTHTGGYTPFRFDVTDYLKDGENILALYAEDDARPMTQPRGKQATKFYSSGCDYTRTTGIWQTVYLEHTPEDYIENFKFYPDPEKGILRYLIKTTAPGEIKINTSFEGKDTGSVTERTGGTLRGEIKLSETHLWEIGKGGIYDAEIIFGDDKVKTYFGLSDPHMEGKKFILNGKSVFQRLVLDQGFYPDGIYTAPTEEDLIKDIKLSMDAGFNGARLHEKVFEPRFLYHADRLGYMVWGEYPNWGFDLNRFDIEPFMINWREAMERDFNHPSLVGWCPFNETWGTDHNQKAIASVSAVYKMTKDLDPSRPVIDTSGLIHTSESDIFDIHDYEQNVEKFASHYEKLSEGIVKDVNYADGYKGGPMFVSEYGGIGLKSDSGWSYGEAPEDAPALIRRYDGLTTCLLDNPDIFAFCYTQLYDIEQEINGLYTYDHVPKMDISKIRAINEKTAAIEK